MGRRVLDPRELVQQARGHVGSQGGGAEEEGGEDEEGAHGRNVAGASRIALWKQVSQRRCYHHVDGACYEIDVCTIFNLRQLMAIYRLG